MVSQCNTKVAVIVKQLKRIENIQVIFRRIRNGIAFQDRNRLTSLIIPTPHGPRNLTNPDEINAALLKETQTIMSGHKNSLMTSDTFKKYTGQYGETGIQ